MIFDARVLAFGVSRNYVRWGRDLGPELVDALAGVPVRVYKQGRRFRHPHESDETDTRGLVGVVASATATRTEVLAVLEIFDSKFATGLLALERDHLLARTIGLSLSADVLYRPTVELGQAVRLVTRIRDVVALDCVSFPSADGRILKSA